MREEGIIVYHGYEEDKLKEACGVFGICGPNDEVSPLTFDGLCALQHRGQESAGIAVSDGHHLNLQKGMGLVSEVFSRQNLHTFAGKMAIGHVRYSTMGSSLPVNAQPFMLENAFETFALAHNGNLTNAVELREALIEAGVSFETSTDSELIIHLINRYHHGDLEKATKKAMYQLRGAYALVILGEEKVIGVRDPYGLRPLCIGQLKNSFCLASESCALDRIGARFVRDVNPGEIVVLDGHGIHTHQVFPSIQKTTCAFEYIYFAHPESTIDRLNVWESRWQMGVELAKEHAIDADIVIAVPSSGTPAARGYASKCGLPFKEGLLKDGSGHRTFIQPTQARREETLKLKLKTNPDVLKNQRVIMVDDSMVRGTTASRLVNLVRSAGAREVHLLIASPPIIYPCYYGIDTVEQERLIAAQMDITEIRDNIKADSLYYLSEAGLLRALQSQRVCLACFNQNYPVKISGTYQKYHFEHQCEICS